VYLGSGWKHKNIGQDDARGDRPGTGGIGHPHPHHPEPASQVAWTSSSRLLGLYPRLIHSHTLGQVSRFVPLTNGEPAPRAPGRVRAPKLVQSGESIGVKTAQKHSLPRAETCNNAPRLVKCPSSPDSHWPGISSARPTTLNSLPTASEFLMPSL